VIFSAVYMLTLYRRTIFGALTDRLPVPVSEMDDVTARELLPLLALAGLVVLLGVKPGLVFDITEGASLRVLEMMAGG